MHRFLVKIGVLLVLLVVVQGIVAYVYPVAVPEAITHFQSLLDDQVDIIYMGDSTLWHPTGSQTTASMLQEWLPDQKVGELSHAAYGLDVYQSYIDYLARQPYRPKLIILPINMRSFSPEWERRPGYQFTMEKRMLRMGLPLTELFGRPLRLFGGYQTDITQDQFLRSEVNDRGTPVGEVADFEDSVGGAASATGNNEQFVYYQELSENPDYPRLLTYYFMNKLEPNHRKVRAMVDIVHTLQAAQIQVLFYFTPVNVELGDVHLGEAFRQQFTANVDLVKAELAGAGMDSANVLDFSYDLAAYFFSDTEHLRQPGKQYIAEQLARHIDPAALTPATTPTMTAEAPVVETTPTPAAADPNATPVNPLLATTIARATEAAGGTVATPVAPAADTSATPIANPLLATAVMRATEAAQP